jgi:hypothetical protein
MLWRGQPPPKLKKQRQNTALGKEEVGGTPGPGSSLSADHSTRVALRREQRNHFVSNHRKNRATGKGGDANYSRHKHSPRKGRNGGTIEGCS